MVFYRKYRPQKIAELDNKQVRDTLYSILSQPNSPHAFLFTGPKGLGKTSTARIVAKAINCERLANGLPEARSKKPEAGIEPCNTCNQCTSITNGTNMDVLEIDAASNRGIDEIRDLREKLRLAPLSAKKKVYIIDEVHMLTTEAFNALLKTLEEPPAHVVFILCTTESHKVPATILSRCFHIQFTLATPEELKASFKRIVESEKITIDDDALSYIARLSDGSFRDGAKVLEEVVLAANGNSITQAVVEQKYKISNVSGSAQNLWDYLLQKDTQKALEVVSALVENGSDLKYFVEFFTKEIHALLLQKAGVPSQSVLESKTPYSIDDLKKIAAILNGVYRDMKISVLPQLPLELAIIEWGESTQKNAELYAEKRQKTPAQHGLALSSAEISEKQETKSATTQKEDILSKLVEQLRSNKEFTLAGLLLRGCSLGSFDNKVLVIITKFKYHKDHLSERKSLSALEKAAEEAAGSKVVVNIELKE